jgi:hypothetical protein
MTGLIVLYLGLIATVIFTTVGIHLINKSIYEAVQKIWHHVDLQDGTVKGILDIIDANRREFWQLENKVGNLSKRCEEIEAATATAEDCVEDDCFVSVVDKRGCFLTADKFGYVLERYPDYEHLDVLQFDLDRWKQSNPDADIYSGYIIPFEELDYFDCVYKRHHGEDVPFLTS